MGTHLYEIWDKGEDERFKYGISDDLIEADNLYPHVAIPQEESPSLIHFTRHTSAKTGKPIHHSTNH